MKARRGSFAISHSSYGKCRFVEAASAAAGVV
jgi:hypothetical protein